MYTVHTVKCNNCPKSATHTNGWEYCNGNGCEMDVRNKTVDDFVKFIDKHTHIKGDEICLDDDITILAEEFLKGETK